MSLQATPSGEKHCVVIEAVSMQKSPRAHAFLALSYQRWSFPGEQVDKGTPCPVAKSQKRIKTCIHTHIIGLAGLGDECKKLS